MLLKKKRVLGVKTESTVGTAETLAAADCTINAYNVVVQPDIAVDQREGQGGFGRLASITGPRMGKATFSVDFAYAGAAAVPTWASTLLPACGMVLSTATFYPRTEVPGSNVKTLTIGAFGDGKLKQIYGAVGNAKFNFNVGKMITVDFEFSGVYSDESDTAIPSSINYVNTLPLRYAGGATTWDAVSLFLQSATLDLRNVITPREQSTTAAGVHSFVITDRNPMVKANPESKLVATQARYTQLTAHSESTLSFTIAGPTTSTVVISAPKAQIVALPEGDRGGIVTDEIEWQLNKNVDTADQEFSIAFVA
jgi:hypothetical protein